MSAPDGIGGKKSKTVLFVRNMLALVYAAGFTVLELRSRPYEFLPF